MRKFLGVVLSIALLISASFAAEVRVLKLGILSKLNTTEQEFAETWKKTFAPNNETLRVDVRFYDSLTAMQMALSAGEITQMVLPEAAANYIISRNPEYEATLSLRSNGTYGLSFGFLAENTALRDKFNEALSSLQKNWRMSTIEGRYIASYGAAEPEPVKFEKFEGKGTMRVAVTGDMPPIDLIAADGTPAGFNTAVLAEVGNALQMNVELVNIDVGARTAALASGRADVVFWYEVAASEKTQFDVPDGVILSQPYYEWNKFIHVKKRQPSGSSSSNWDVKRSIWDMLFQM